MPLHKFTARSLPKPPTSGRIDYWDAALPGFGMRVSSGGTRTWIVMFRHNGVKRRMKLGRYPALGLAAAREDARDALQKAEKGRDPASERRAARARMDTVEDLAREYVEGHAKKKKRSWRKDDQILKREVLKLIGGKRIIDVTRQDIRDVLKPIIDREAPVRANHTLEVVRKMFNWGIAERDLPILNPAALVPKPGEAKARKRYLKPDELGRFWRALDAEELGESGVAAFKLLLLTAQREMEVLRMRWEEIDWEELLWTIPADNTKNELEHVVPLSPYAALKVLAPLYAEAMIRKKGVAGRLAPDSGRPHEPLTGYVFRSPLNPIEHVRRVFIEKRILKIRATSQISDVTVHDLRRTVTTYLGKVKVPQPIKKKILNHAKRKKSDVTDIYDRFEYVDEKRDALVKWADLLLAIVGEKAETDGLATALIDDSGSNVVALHRPGS